MGNLGYTIMMIGVFVGLALVVRAIQYLADQGWASPGWAGETARKGGSGVRPGQGQDPVTCGSRLR
ncbi:MAG: hypothetical protein QOG57_5255 [Pseudonocardiales bacterium]|nr:hypothetical protein [Pseudonocardiales bacterium]